MRTVIPKDAHLVPEYAERVFEGVIYDVYHWQQEMFDGSTEIFEMIKRPDSVRVFVIEDNKILVQKQEQPFIGSFFSFPGGRHDVEGETEIKAVARELKEEAGLEMDTFTLIDVVQPHSYTDFLAYAFVATGIKKKVEPKLDAGEKIENVWMTLDEVQTHMNEGLFRFDREKMFDGLIDADALLEVPEYRA